MVTLLERREPHLEVRELVSSHSPVLQLDLAHLVDLWVVDPKKMVIFILCNAASHGESKAKG
jgi:hypothetical protein